MKKYRMLILAGATIFAGTMRTSFADGLVLVYKGYGSCKEGCSKAASTIARTYGMRTRYVGPEEITEELLSRASAWIQPGGDARELWQAISPERKQLLRNFVKSGGDYLGFCAGAYFADKTVDDANTMEGLGLFEGTTVDYPIQPSLRLVLLRWGKQLRNLYFEDGPYFAFAPGFQAQIIAEYKEGFPAAAQFTYGLGHVALSGVHPEAPMEWMEANNLEPEGAKNMDLAVEMLRWATESTGPK